MQHKKKKKHEKITPAAGTFIEIEQTACIRISKTMKKKNVYIFKNITIILLYKCNNTINPNKLHNEKKKKERKNTFTDRIFQSRNKTKKKNYGEQTESTEQKKRKGNKTIGNIICLIIFVLSFIRKRRSIRATQIMSNP